MGGQVKEKPLSPEQILGASRNYLHCLNLPPSSQVLVITDMKSKSLLPYYLSEKDTALRDEIATSIGRQIDRNGGNVSIVRFDDSLSLESFKVKTVQALNDLEDNVIEGAVDRTTTVVYLGEKWENRSGMYMGAEEFGQQKKRTIRWAGSLGFSSGDARVMSELTQDKIEKIDTINGEFEKFFESRPEGSFEITTRGIDGKEHILNLKYDTAKAPFESDTGKFDDNSKVMLSEHVKYINIPGGEKFASPYPYQNTNGEFAAEGMLFSVKNGLVESIIELEEGAKDSKDPMQKALINLVEKGNKIPVSELGLGYYAMLGIKTYSDSSILSREKSGPHIGFATAPGSTVEEKALEAASKGFHHTDFVLDNPVLIWSDINGSDREQFYPPLRQNSV